jgi:hypothetical protein
VSFLEKQFNTLNQLFYIIKMNEYNLEKFGLSENTQKLSEKNKKNISISLKSLPEYIFLVDGKVVDVLNFIINSKLSLTNINKKFKGVIKQDRINRLYYSLNTHAIKDISEDMRVLLLGGLDIQKFRKNLNEKIAKLQKLKEKALEIAGIKWENFSTENLRVNIAVKSKNELGNLFNKFKTNKDIPFAFLKRTSQETLYKFLLNYVVPENWGNFPDELENKSFILLKFVKDKREHDIFLFVENEKLTIRLKVENFSFYENFIKSVLLSSLKITEDEIAVSIDKIRCKSEYNIKSTGDVKKINKYVLLDLIFNDKDFSKYLCVNEFEKASKDKTVVFAYFSKPGEQNIEEKRCPGKSIIITPYLDIYSGTEKFIVTIKEANNPENYKYIFTVMGFLFKKYLEKLDGIVKYYRNYIPKFAQVKKNLKKKKKIKLSEIDNVLYDTKYNFSRTCQKNKSPTITLERPEEFDQSESRYSNGILRFPDFEIDSIKPRYYKCEKEKYKSVGLVKVGGENAPDHPTSWLPCCFKKDQTEKGALKTYLDNGVESLKDFVSKRKTKQIRISETDKFATKELKKFDSKINIDILKALTGTDNSFLRMGVFKGEIDPNSLLHCVCEEFDKKYQELATWEQKQNYVYAKRINYSSPELIGLCKQQLFDKSDQDIRDALEDNKIYFDPSLFLNFLQNEYEINIFMFEKKGNTLEMVSPRNKNGYYYSLYDTSMLIYLNYGSLSFKNIPFPQCEVISSWDGKSESVNMSTKDIDKKFLININNDIILKNKKVEFYQKFRVKERYFKSQNLDNSGKTRIIEFSYQNYKGVVMTSPLEPLNLPTQKDIKIKNVTLDLAERFLKEIFEENLDFTYCLDNGNIKRVKVSKGGLTLEIPVQSERNISGRSVCMSEKVPSKKSTLLKFERTRKLSFIVKNYFLWLYSKYGEQLSVEDFSKNYTIIDKNFDYSLVIDNRFSLKSPILKGEKLLIDSIETRKRLEYCLKIHMVTHKRALELYKYREFIVDYYQNKNDFTKNSTEIIIEGDKSFKNIATKHDYNYTMYRKVRPESKKPYFFKNNQISDKDMYLCENTRDLNFALYKGQKWKKDRINPQEPISEKIQIDFTLYSYESETKIKKHIIGEGGATGPLIIGYLLDGKPAYTTLLKI